MNDHTTAFKVLENYGNLVIRTVPMPSDCNHGGTIFGGWILSQIDIGASLAAIHYSSGRVVTKAVEKVTFIKPIHVHNQVDIYAKLSKVGNTSVTFDVYVFVSSRTSINELAVTANIVFVRIDDNHKPIGISKLKKESN
ncbi:acyl-CoA thioesterase [Fastidiosibacter lacustris]|uniref:acyl-CoA thioesterase n=1 Tax=Fastidiosibacter lacustris TaxID=2056695 RepID=UPI000E353518|nr:acyl-CoA thioesterase [Fastidiosibacter lacustris]